MVPIRGAAGSSLNTLITFYAGIYKTLELHRTLHQRNRQRHTVMCQAGELHSHRTLHQALSPFCSLFPSEIVHHQAMVLSPREAITCLLLIKALVSLALRAGHPGPRQGFHTTFHLTINNLQLEMLGIESGTCCMPKRCSVPALWLFLL